MNNSITNYFLWILVEMFSCTLVRSKKNLGDNVKIYQDHDSAQVADD